MGVQVFHTISYLFVRHSQMDKLIFKGLILLHENVQLINYNYQSS